MTSVITKGDNPGNYIYVDVNADFATVAILFWNLWGIILGFCVKSIIYNYRKKNQANQII